MLVSLFPASVAPIRPAMLFFLAIYASGFSRVADSSTYLFNIVSIFQLVASDLVYSCSPSDFGVPEN